MKDNLGIAKEVAGVRVENNLDTGARAPRISHRVKRLNQNNDYCYY